MLGKLSPDGKKLRGSVLLPANKTATIQNSMKVKLITSGL
jgi:hypothetical protein